MSENNLHRSCLELFARMSEYLDEEVDGAMRRTIEQHLARCRNCRVCLQTLQRTVRLCREMGSVPVPEETSRRLRRYIASLANR